MSEFFNRDVSITIGDLNISARDSAQQAQTVLKMVFNIEKTRGSDPNKAKLSIWNLSAASRAKLQEKNCDVVIEAGYVDYVNQIFKGTMDFATNTREGTDWITTLEVGDGSKETKQSRINESFKAGTSAGQVLKKAAESLGLDTGNLLDVVNGDGARSLLKQWVSGKVVSGKSSDVLDDISKSLGLDWSIQDRKLQFIDKGIRKAGESQTVVTTKDPAVPLKPSKGLIGSPEVGEDGIVKARSLLNGELFPNRKIDLESLLIKGAYRIEKVVHDGDTGGGNWYSDLELRPI